MISRLIYTKCTRNSAPMMFFLFASGFLLFLVCFSNRQGISINALYLAYGLISLLLYLFIGGVVHKNENREKRIRLYSQLPVSNLEIRIASWYFIAIFLCIPTFLWFLALLYISDLSYSNLLLYTLLFYFHAAVLVALVYLYTQYITLMTIIEQRKLKPLVLIVLFVLSLFGFFLILGGDIFILDRNIINWSILVILFITPCLGLIATDIYLYKKSENYLG